MVLSDGIWPSGWISMLETVRFPASISDMSTGSPNIHTVTRILLSLSISFPEITSQNTWLAFWQD